MAKPRGFHLIGSVPLESPEQVFSTLCSALPGYLQSIPDGEIGTRTNFVRWQHFVFPPEIIQMRHPGAKPAPSEAPVIRLEDIKPTQYETMAIESYEVFKKSRESGVIPSNVKFQVSLPTPTNVVWAIVKPEFRKAVAPFYEQRLIEALRKIQEAIPNEDLAIQIDAAAEMGYIEHAQGRLQGPLFEPFFDNVLETSADIISRFSSFVNPAVALGYHLCYGDINHTHFVQPQDMENMVLLANAFVKRVQSKHPISWIHMPVPIDRNDTAYFAPLKKLDIGATRLVLGLIHEHDHPGTYKRIEAAQSQWDKVFAVATECGQGRTPPEDLPKIFEIAKSVSEPW